MPPAESHTPLKASLAELADISSLSPDAGDADDAEARRALAAELDPLPSFDIPLDRPVTTAAAIAAELAASGPAMRHVTGAAGGAPALLLRAITHKTKRRIVAIPPDV